MALISAASTGTILVLSIMASKVSAPFSLRQHSHSPGPNSLD